MAIAKEPVNVHDVLHGSGAFGAEEVRTLEEALMNGQTSEVRQEVQRLKEEIEEGERGKAKMLRAGVACFLLGQHEEGSRILSRISGDGLADFYRGQVLLALGRYHDSAKAFEQGSKNGYDSVQCLLARAGAVRASGNIDQAEELLKSAAASGGGTRAEYCYQMGCILADRGDTYGAVEYFERAVDMNPGHQRALFWLAGINASRGNDEDAIRLYERALARPPLHAGAMINLGLLYEDAENYSAAAFCFKRVLDSFPTHQRALLYLKDIESAHDMYYDEESLRSQARLKQVLEIPVTDFELSVRARNCLQKMGVRNLGDLTRLSEQDLLGGKNFGETSLKEIKEMMESRGLGLGQFALKEKPRDVGYQESLTPQQQALLNRPVSELNLSVRARKCMSRLGIASVGELILRTPDELLESKNFGVTSLNEVRAKLSDLGLRLRND
ncbi:MAG: DNA-directed RNA polymerase subunit alpha C-terminal domain-containing protein [Planctomycetaceae bacterium]